MSQIRLSICIVTYNDAIELSETLAGLQNDAELWIQLAQDSVELIVSDNASLDNTEGLLSDFEATFPGKIRRFRQSINLGFRGNLEFCLSEAAGEWILFLGAGDRLETRKLGGAHQFLGRIFCPGRLFQFIYVRFGNWNMRVL